MINVKVCYEAKQKVSSQHLVLQYDYSIVTLLLYWHPLNGTWQVVACSRKFLSWLAGFAFLYLCTLVVAPIFRMLISSLNSSVTV